jgi:hypothetical protein
VEGLVFVRALVGRIGVFAQDAGSAFSNRRAVLALAFLEGADLTGYQR